MQVILEARKWLESHQSVRKVKFANERKELRWKSLKSGQFAKSLMFLTLSSRHAYEHPKPESIASCVSFHFQGKQRIVWTSCSSFPLLLLVASNWLAVCWYEARFCTLISSFLSKRGAGTRFRRAGAGAGAGEGAGAWGRKGGGCQAISDELRYRVRLLSSILLSKELLVFCSLKSGRNSNELRFDCVCGVWGCGTQTRQLTPETMLLDALKTAGTIITLLTHPVSWHSHRNDCEGWQAHCLRDSEAVNIHRSRLVDEESCRKRILEVRRALKEAYYKTGCTMTAFLKEKCDAFNRQNFRENVYLAFGMCEKLVFFKLIWL